jgi:AraC-like DNA-binding protein
MATFSAGRRQSAPEAEQTLALFDALPDVYLFVKDRQSRFTRVNDAWLVCDQTGMPRWYLCTKLPLFAADGAVSGLAGVLRLFDHAGNAPDEYRRLTPVLEYVIAHYRQRISVEDLAGRAGLSGSQLQREFRRLFGMRVGDYLLRLRILMAQRRLRETADAIGRIATDCGFYDQSHFTRAFKAHTGLPPQQYRRLKKPRAEARGHRAVGRARV